MAEIIFQHERVAPAGGNQGDPLQLSIGPDEISWGYNVNTAKYPTYGGEVIQILSVYVDDMTVGGSIRTYEEAEGIYEYFMAYFSIATQTANANASAEDKFEQTPMVFKYPERNWTFYIQPMAAPGFEYGSEVVAPKWQIQAHIVDRGLNAESLKNYIGKAAQDQLEKLEHGLESFHLSGHISPDSGDPSKNPFIAPNTPTTKKGGQVTFEPYSAKEVTEGLGKIADFYTSLLPSYLKGDFADVAGVSGSKPIFGRKSETTEEPEELTRGKPAGGKEPPKTN